jgi:Ca2+:H+ antiporter
LSSHRYRYEKTKKEDLERGVSSPGLELPEAVVETKYEAENKIKKESRDNLGAESDDDDDEDELLLGFYTSIFWLGVVTVFILILSDALVGSIEDAADTWHISSTFLSAIVIPIVGNAAEHAGALTFALKNRLDLTLGIALGSGTQIALFVIPLLVIIGLCVDRPVHLDFQSFEAFTLFTSVVLVSFVLKDGKSNYLSGLLLVGAYFVVATGFWVHENELHPQQ